MGVRAFISATKEDLGHDCRPRVIQAVELCQAAAVTMETWDADFEDPVRLCRQKIEEESSHYLGIFSYRYGWAPPALGKSITQAEFEWARDYGKPMVVFVPNPTSDFAAVLRERAKAQSEADRARQEAFLAAVSSLGTYQPFDDVIDLAIRVTRKVQIWSGGGLRAVAEEASARAAQAPPPSLKPSEDDLHQLGRDDHFQSFKATLMMLVDPAVSNRVCFLIHGPPSFGQRALSTRLRKYVEDSSRAPEVHCAVSIGPLWRQHGLARLLQLLGGGLDPHWAPETPQALALRLAEVLAVNDIIFEIADVQRFDGGVPGFVKHFWVPLLDALPARTRHRLVVLLALEQEAADAWEPWLQKPPPGADAFDPARLVRLPALAIFTQQELAGWLQRWFAPDDAWLLAETLIGETGGTPQALYNKLRDDATWIL